MGQQPTGPSPTVQRRPPEQSGPSVPEWLDRAAAVSWRLLVVGAAVLATLWLLSQLALAVLPVVVAVIVSTLTVPPTRRLQRAGWSPAAATTTVVVGGLTLLVGLLVALAPFFAEQIQQLGPSLARGRAEIIGFLADSPLNLNAEGINDLIEQARRSASQSTGQIVSGVLTGATVVVEGLAALALVLVLLFFFTKDGEQILAWFVARTPERYREPLRAVGSRAWQTLGGYVRGTATIALVDAVGVAAGLLIIQVPLVAPLAILVFFGAFLPVIGAFIAGLIAVLVAAASGGLGDALLTLAVIVGVQQVEGNVLQPVIMRRAVALHPVVVLVALAVGATVGGIVGAFLSVPVAAVLSAVGNELRLRAQGAD